MSAEWYAIELSEHGVCALPEDVARAVRSTVPGVEVFVPAYVVRSGSSSFVMDVYEGYIFVRRGDYDPNDLLQSTLLTRILMRGSGSKTTPVLLGTEAIEKILNTEPGS